MKKLLVLMLALAGVIGIGIFVLNGQQQESQPETPHTQPEDSNGEQAKDFEVTDAMARAVIQNVLGDTFDASGATYAVANIDGKGGPELLIGAKEKTNDLYAQAKAMVHVVTLMNLQGQYEHRGTIEIPEPARTAPQLKEFIDLTGNNVQEMFITLGFGGASNVAHGFLRLNATEGKLEWIQLESQTGQVRDAIFIVGGTVTHTETVHFSEGTIVEIFTQLWEPTELDNTIPHKQLDDTWCLVRAYQWEGDVFRFNKALSEQFLDTLGTQCTM